MVGRSALLREACCWDPEAVKDMRSKRMLPAIDGSDQSKAPAHVAAIGLIERDMLRSQRRPLLVAEKVTG